MLQDGFILRLATGGKCWHEQCGCSSPLRLDSAQVPLYTLSPGPFNHLYMRKAGVTVRRLRHRSQGLVLGHTGLKGAELILETSSLPTDLDFFPYSRAENRDIPEQRHHQN